MSTWADYAEMLEKAAGIAAAAGDNVAFAAFSVAAAQSKEIARKLLEDVKVET